MKIAVLTQKSNLFGLVRQCFEPDEASCHQFVDEVVLARTAYRDEFSAILVDAEIGLNRLRPFLARRACYADKRAPLIMMGISSNRASIACALDAGADDVVPAPIETRELKLRVDLAIRRFTGIRTAGSDGVIKRGAYRLDRHTCVVHVEGDAVRLTPREFAIAWLLFSRYGEYVSRRQIAGAVWSSSEDIIGRTLEQHIYKLRKKLELHGAHGIHLRTMYAHGYRIEALEAPEYKCECEREGAMTAAPLPRLSNCMRVCRPAWRHPVPAGSDLELDDAR